MMSTSRQRGFTIIELMITMVIGSILLAFAVPSFIDLVDKNRVKGATERLYGDFQFARSEAMKRNLNVRLSFQKNLADGTSWCYGFTLNNSCNCNTAGDCALDGVEKVVKSSEFNGVKLLTLVGIAATGTGQMTYGFTARRGAANSGSVLLESSQGRRTQLTIGGIGRVKVCSPATGNIHDYPVCPTP